MSNKQRRGGLGRGPRRADPDRAAGRPPTRAPARSEPRTAVTPSASAHRRRPSTRAEARGRSPQRCRRRRPTRRRAAPAGVRCAVPGARFAELPIAAIHANAKQPRQVFDEDALAELTHSIREFGVLQPVVVREPERPAATSWSWASGGCGPPRRPGWTRIPAIVRDTADDAMLRDALLENIHRAQLNPLEEAAAYQQLLEEFGATHDELAQPDRPQPLAGHQHDPAAQPAGAGPAPGRRRRALGRPRPGAARPRRRATRRTSWPPASSPRGCRCAPPRSSCRCAGAAAQQAARAARRGPRITAPAVAELGRQAVRRLRHPGAGRARPAQGQDHRRVRVGRRPGADRRRDGPRAGDPPAPAGEQPSRLERPVGRRAEPSRSARRRRPVAARAAATASARPAPA